MPSKKNTWDINTFRTFFGNRKFNGNFFWRHPYTKLSSGFTLIEILIAVALIGIMAVGIIIALDPLAQIQKAQDAKRKSDLSQIQKALETYYQDYGRYPQSSPDNITLPHRIVNRFLVVEWGSTDFQPYMSILPKDPSSSKKYVYNSTGLDGQTYYLYASLDRGANDPQACPKGNKNFAVCDNAIYIGVYMKCADRFPEFFCNYGVTSPNVSP